MNTFKNTFTLYLASDRYCMSKGRTYIIQHVSSRTNNSWAPLQRRNGTSRHITNSKVYKREVTKVVAIFRPDKDIIGATSWWWKPPEFGGQNVSPRTPRIGLRQRAHTYSFVLLLLDLASFVDTSVKCCFVGTKLRVVCRIISCCIQR